MGGVFHEKFDGTGYPDRLRGDEIPLTAQIVCIADVYDALITSRSYRAAFSRSDALIEMHNCRRWWRPDVYGAFLATVGNDPARAADRWANRTFPGLAE